MIYNSKYGKIYYELIGNGIPIVFLHGWGQDSSTFNSVYEKLEDEYSILKIDLLGFGQSDEPIRALSVDNYADILADLLLYLDIKKPIIVSHSLGGRIAIKYIYKYNNVRQLFLISSAGIKPKRGIIYYYRIYSYKIKKRIFKLFRLNKKLASLLQNSGSSDYKNSSPIMKATLSKVVNENLFWMLKKIKVDTIIFWGIDDDMTPYSDGLKFNREIKNSRLITFYSSKHFLYLTEHNKFMRELKKYIWEGENGSN